MTKIKSIAEQFYDDSDLNLEINISKNLENFNKAIKKLLKLNITEIPFIIYNPGLFSSSNIERIVNHFSYMNLNDEDFLKLLKKDNNIVKMNLDQFKATKIKEYTYDDWAILSNQQLLDIRNIVNKFYFEKGQFENYFLNRDSDILITHNHLLLTQDMFISLISSEDDFNRLGYDLSINSKGFKDLSKNKITIENNKLEPEYSRIIFESPHSLEDLSHGYLKLTVPKDNFDLPDFLRLTKTYLKEKVSDLSEA